MLKVARLSGRHGGEKRQEWLKDRVECFCTGGSISGDAESAPHLPSLHWPNAAPGATASIRGLSEQAQPVETIQTPWAAADEPTESPGRGERLPEVIKGGPAAFPALEPLCQAPTSRSLSISVFID